MHEKKHFHGETAKLRAYCKPTNGSFHLNPDSENPVVIGASEKVKILVIPLHLMSTFNLRILIHEHITGFSSP